MATGQGCGMIFFSRNPRLVLAYRRDNIPGIPAPGLLDLLGGHVEDGETPEEAMVREIAEELDHVDNGKPIKISPPALFEVLKSPEGVVNHVYCQEAHWDIPDVRLKEGERLVWINEHFLVEAEFAFGFGEVVRRFFKSGIMDSPAVT